MKVRLTLCAMIQILIFLNTLFNYSSQLNSIDNMRVDGKFLVGTDIPEGQASVNALMAECYDISYELRAQAEENDSD